ncbi:hypothetical protein [Geotalea sp. SG265]|uniref:ATP-grasp domain-containing protein n=1 Tax=Geotalea sp. SG265 TaxID=2922867 RepID=UPI001FB008F6|nr:hypothetical protein [Geotalea sp. SG265]
MRRLLKRYSLYMKQRDLFPGLRQAVQRHFNLIELRTAHWAAKNPYDERFDVSEYVSPYPFTFGIVKEFWHNHRFYIRACRELKVSYRVLDLTRPDWLETVTQSACDAFLVVPSVNFSFWKQMYDERIRVLVEVLGKRVFPSYEAMWMWESKRRMHYWLKANGIPHPETWIFYDRKEALGFADTAPLPLVFKSDMGSGASGVIIFRDRGRLRRHINICFRKGFTNYRRGPTDRETGTIFLQEYLPDAREWRVVRIGASYFAFEKMKAGEFHSGSHLRSFARPSSVLLSFARGVFDTGDFSSMSLDIFVTRDGRYLVNELQTYFGIQDNHEMCVVDGVPGRMVHDPQHGTWAFQAGSFCDNYLYNQRLSCFIEQLQWGDQGT